MVDQTPPELETLVALLNTLDERTYTHRGAVRIPGDELETAAALESWLTEHRLIARGTRVTASDRELVVSFRNNLRRLLSSAEARRTKQRQRDINRVLIRIPLTVQFGADASPELTVNARGASAVMCRLAAGLATSQARGTWHRVHICAAPDCRWAFYDTSRNGTGRWCSMAICGNRHKTRRYRERLSAE